MGEFFDATDPFHEFVEECMERKNTRGLSQREVQQEFEECIDGWNRAKAGRQAEDVDEEALAAEFLDRR